MPITATDLNAYQSANMPEADGVTSGGAINANGRVKPFPQSGDTQPKADSTDAGDTQTLTIGGITDTGEWQEESKALTGTTQITFTNFTFTRILKMVLSGAATGTVTLFMNDGTTTIQSLAPGETSNRGLFYQSASDPSATRTRYEKLFWRNDHGTLTLNAAFVSLSADPQGKFRIAVEPSADDSVTDRLNEPAGSPAWTDDPTPIDITSLAAGVDVGVWVEQALGVADAAFNSSFTTKLEGTTAA